MRLFDDGLNNNIFIRRVIFIVNTAVIAYLIFGVIVYLGLLVIDIFIFAAALVIRIVVLVLVIIAVAVVSAAFAALSVTVLAVNIACVGI